MKLRYCVPVVAAVFLALSGCEKSGMEKAEDKVNDALDNRPNEELRDAAEDVQDAAKDAGEAVKDVANDVAEGTKEAAHEVQEAVKEATH